MLLREDTEILLSEPPSSVEIRGARHGTQQRARHHRHLSVPVAATLSPKRSLGARARLS